jgi:hypothetical protein
MQDSSWTFSSGHQSVDDDPRTVAAMSEGSGVTPVARLAPHTGRAASQRVVTAVSESIRSMAPPPVPLSEAWHIGLGHLVRSMPRVPDRLTRLVSPLDRVAEVSLGPNHVGFDGAQVAWRDVTEVRLGSVLDVLSVAVVEKELGRITSLLPPVPGRTWVATQIAELGLGLVAAVTQTVVEGRLGDTDNEEGQPALVPLGVTTRGRLGRRRDLVPGLFSTLLCVAVPGVTTAISTTAREHGVGIAVPPGGDTARRAAQLRRTSETLLSFVDARLSRPEEDPGAPANPPDNAHAASRRPQAEPD